MPEQVNQRRYEALHGLIVEGLTHAQTGGTRRLHPVPAFDLQALMP